MTKMKFDTAPKPPMGWNSWDCFGVDVTEEEVKANAKYMADNLKEFGWEYVVVDLAWYGQGITALGEQYKMQCPPQLMDEFGRFIPNPDLHPSAANGAGFKPLADYVHSLGLKFGIHIMRGMPWAAAQEKCKVKGTDTTCDMIAIEDELCPWYNGTRTINMTHPAGQAYYDSIAELYASWDVDFIKADDMNYWSGEGGSPYRADEIEGLAKALQKAGRPMTLSLSPGGARLSQANHLQNHAHMWRISPDFWDSWPSLLKQFENCAKWAPFTGSGSWPDADMLPMGRIGIRAEMGKPRSTDFTYAEQRTMLTLWSIARSPLMFGGHMPENDEQTLALITNPEILNVNQASRDGRQHSRTADTVIWTATPEDGKGLYVAAFNIGEQDGQAIAIDFASLGLSGECTVRDLWARADLGAQSGSLTASLDKHDGALFLVTPV